MKLYTIGEAAAILDSTKMEVVRYCEGNDLGWFFSNGDEPTTYKVFIPSHDLEKIREARRYRPL